jgi:SAM-dependent methyltransferase
MGYNYINPFALPIIMRIDTQVFYDRVARACYGDAATKRLDPVRAVEDAIRYRTVRRYIRPGAHVLDLGCGDGFSTLYATDAASYMGVDISDEMVRQAQLLRGRKGTCTFLQHDLDFGLPSSHDIRKRYDAAISFYGSLSHLCAASFKALLAELRTRLHPQSSVIVDLLNDTSLDRDSDLWLPNKTDLSMGEYSMRYAAGEMDVSIRFYDPAEIASLFERQGYRVQEVFTVSGLAGRHNTSQRLIVNKLLARGAVSRDEVLGVSDRITLPPCLESAWREGIVSALDASPAVLQQQTLEYLLTEVRLSQIHPHGHSLIIVAEV